jgi:hypothetical protein
MRWQCFNGDGLVEAGSGVGQGVDHHVLSSNSLLAKEYFKAVPGETSAKMGA